MRLQSTDNKSIVYIVDDDHGLCQSLRWLLESVGLTIKIYNSSTDFLDHFEPLSPDGCILLDIRMPEISGLEVLEQFRSRYGQWPVIFITGHGDIPLAVRAMKLGAFDFLTKPFNDQVLLERIQKAITDHQKSGKIKSQYIIARRRLQSLTKRELEILQLIVEGDLSKEIAYKLGISIKTIESHRAHIMHKMGAAKLAELVKFYLWAIEPA